MIGQASPLRYPGGKAKIRGLISSILKKNGLEKCHYVEPYAGGCGLALSLLYDDLVSNIYINDIDIGVWAFWESVLNDTERLVAKITRTPVSIEEWHKQKNILEKAYYSDTLDVGFATFFLNRTNRSGIIRKASVIGGLRQNGTYKLNCRFNKENLINRILRVSKYKERIYLSNQDASIFLENCQNTLPMETLFFIDPPYYTKGKSIYTNHYTAENHALLSQRICKLNRHWILTYDKVEEIERLYSNNPRFPYGVNYSLQDKKIGKELLIMSHSLKIPPLGLIHKHSATDDERK